MTIPSLRRWGVVDTLICLFVVSAIGGLMYQTHTELDYQWGWDVPLKYIVSVDESGVGGGLLWDGLMMSLRLMVIGGVLALLFGVPVAFAAVSPVATLRWAARLYVEGLRHLPPIVFMFIFFYFISSQWFATDIWRWLIAGADNAIGRFILGTPARAENLLGGVLCLAIFEAAFVAEIIRGGILSIPHGQWDAANSLGLSRWRVLRLVVLPQVIARVAAPLTGQVILLVKDSAILSVISVQELTFSAQETAVSTQQIFETWLLAAGFYFMLCWPLLALSRRWENRLRV